MLNKKTQMIQLLQNKLKNSIIKKAIIDYVLHEAINYENFILLINSYIKRGFTEEEISLMTFYRYPTKVKK